VAVPSDAEAGTRTWGLLGVPSSVAAHWPGIEQGPAALREAGLLEIATYGSGLRLDHVAPLLRTLVADPRVVGMTTVKANPDHDPDGASIRRLVTAVATALAEPVS
jgi:arginase family enzyme